jgi:hypothetical protein
MEVPRTRIDRVGRRVGLICFLLIGAFADASGLPAQQTRPIATTGARTFAAEAIGGTLGSALGIAIGLAIARQNACPPEDDVVCSLRKLGITGIIGVAGATTGTVVAGRWAGSRPSIVGAAVGAAAGAAVGVGLEHLITEEMGRRIGGLGTVVLFSATQRILAAAGSRLVAGLRRE